MSEARSEFLLVQTGSRPVGLLLRDVIEVGDIGEVFAVPSTAPAMRGVMASRGRLVPVLHLDALLTARACPAGMAPVGVLADLGGIRICLEVESADVVTRETLHPVPPGESLPWALAVVRREDGLIPILNLGALRERLLDAETRA